MLGSRVASFPGHGAWDVAAVEWILGHLVYCMFKVCLKCYDLDYDTMLHLLHGYHTFMAVT